MNVLWTYNIHTYADNIRTALCVYLHVYMSQAIILSELGAFGFGLTLLLVSRSKATLHLFFYEKNFMSP